MILEKIKTNEEEQLVDFVEYYAICVDHKEISSEIKLATKLFTLPKHLKHVKSVDKKKYVLLCKVNEYEETKKLRFYDSTLLKKFLVPITSPVTKQQFIRANQAWPCYFYPQNAKKIEIDHIKTHLLLLKTKKIDSKVFCSSICIIFDKEKILAIENDSDHVLGHAIFCAIEKVSTSKYGYLCTNLEALIFNEPCVSCAMAFTHGRIKRVYFVNNNTQTPTFSQYKICYNKALNHRYEVYKIQ